MRVPGFGFLLAAALCSAGEFLPNPSFEQGGQSPAGWRLEGSGAWETTGHTGQRSISVTGTGKDSGAWRTTDFAFQPNTLYRVAFWAKAERAASGCVVSGPSFCNRDFPAQAGWQRHAFCFVSPASVEGAFLRFGQWEVPTTVAFDDIELRPTQAVHEQFGDLTLGEGEEIAGVRYTFIAPLNGEGANHSRPLHSFRCFFNSNRWCFNTGSEVVYRHAIPARKQTAARVELNCNYHTGGAGVVEASADAQTWTPIARFDKVTLVKADVPKSLLPAEALFLRIRGEGGASFQVNEYVYTATLDAGLGELRGSTAYLDIQKSDPDFPVTILAIPSGTGGLDDWRIKIDSRSGRTPKLEVTSTVSAEKGEEQNPPMTPAAMQFAVSSPLRHPGDNTLTLAIRADGTEIYRASVLRRLASLHDASYGYLLPSPEPCPLWWCESPYKVSLTRALPTMPRPTVEISAARNEAEAAQLVLRPKAALKNLRVQVRPLKGDGRTLAPECVRIERVAYLNVTRPTDSAGARGWWPDPLPPFEQGCTLDADRNHPLWITVSVPPDQPAGDYQGQIDLAADGWAASVPLKVKVWDFALPTASRLQTAFGLDEGVIRRYHNLETEAELRQVLDLYLANFAAHRIAPYSPAPLDPFKVEFSTGPWDGGTLDDKDPKEGKQCLRVDDNDPKSSVAAFHAKPLAVDVKQRYQLSWWAKTAKPGQNYLVTLQQYDAAGQWLSGNNIDFPREGTGQWKQEQATIPAEDGRPFNPQTKTVRLALRPVSWSEEGEATGTAWFDDIRFQKGEEIRVHMKNDNGAEREETHLTWGPNLIADGGFEQGVGELKATIDFAAFDRECEKWLDGAGFNALMVGLKGMGGGTFFARSPGRIGGFVQGTPEYDQLMASQGCQIIAHLKAKGWLDRAYIYWFDEPDPKDYAFVADGMEIIKRAAPGLTRMLTEQPEPALFGRVDLWCPLVSAVGPEAIAARRKAGERFWWYLCCGPHAPYIGLFIDHPAVDLRVWAWLSRKWGVTGQLVWTSNYWHSPAAFPDPDMQNPWADPMSYCSGYDFTPGKIGHWGNGDGRFLYPPNREPKADKRKLLCGPVNSIRWEMLRDGVEDYDTFCLLDDLVAAAKKAGKAGDLVSEAERLAAVPDGVIRDDKTYSKDPQPLLTHRRLVGEMVEKLARAMKKQ